MFSLSHHLHSLILGNIFIADNSNNRIRKVTISTGIITTVVGSDSGGFSGDNGAATSAKIKYPNGITLDSSGKYDADNEAHYFNRILLIIILIFQCTIR